LINLLAKRFLSTPLLEERKERKDLRIETIVSTEYLENLEHTCDGLSPARYPGLEVFNSAFELFN